MQYLTPMLGWIARVINMPMESGVVELFVVELVVVVVVVVFCCF